MVIYAHRGASGEAAENTLAAFALAAEQGADAVELDVQISRDGALVVMHDETIDRVTPGTGFLKDYTLGELRALAPVPTLAEVFELLRPTPLQINVELKTGLIMYADLERRTLDLAAEFGMARRVLYSSFNHYSVMKVRELCPEARTAFLFGTSLTRLDEYAAHFGMEAAHLPASMLTAELVSQCHGRGVAVNVWDIRDADIARCMAAHADGVFTNYPARTRALMEKLEHEG